MGKQYYKSVKIRVETYERLKAAMRPGETFDQVVARLLDTVAMLEHKVRQLESSGASRCDERVKVAVEDCVRRHVDATALDKAAWYIVKTVYSVQSLKDLVDMDAPAVLVDQQLTRVNRVLDQVRQRYSIDGRRVWDMVRLYTARNDKTTRIQLNEAVKELVKEIIVRMLALNVIEKHGGGAESPAED